MFEELFFEILCEGWNEEFPCAPQQLQPLPAWSQPGQTLVPSL